VRIAEVFGKSSENNIAQLELSVEVKREARSWAEFGSQRVRKSGGVRKFGVQSSRVDDTMTSNERSRVDNGYAVDIRTCRYIHERSPIIRNRNNDRETIDGKQQRRDNRTEDNERWNNRN